MRPASAGGAGPRNGRAAYWAITALGLGVVLTGLAELFLQLRWDAPSERSTSAFWPHPLYLQGPAPGARGVQVSSEYACTFENNLLGFRGPLPDLATGGERARLLVLGDSQTFGLGVSEGETFCDRLRAAAPQLEVVNAGSNGYGTRESLAVLHHFGAAWRPDAALLVFFWNDLEDNVKHPLPEFELDGQSRVSRVDTYPADFDPLALRAAIQAVPQGASGLRLPKFFKEGLRGLRYRWFGIKRRSIRDREQLDQAWAVAARLLAVMKARADELDCRLVVASLPDHNQVDPEAVIRNIEPLHFEIQERLFAECAALGIETIDLRPALRAAFEAGGAPLYYYADRHLTPRGHAVVAEALAPFAASVSAREAARPR